MKRVALFLVTNIAILVVLSVVVQLLGLEPVLARRRAQPGRAAGLRRRLRHGRRLHLAGHVEVDRPSAWSARRSSSTPRNAAERWLVETVRRQAQAAGIGMPEVAIYDAPEVNAFATGMSRNNALVAVSHRAAARHDARRGRGGAGARGLATSPTATW